LQIGEFMDDFPLTAATTNDCHPFDVLFVPQKVKYCLVLSQMPYRNSSVLHQYVYLDQVDE